MKLYQGTFAEREQAIGHEFFEQGMERDQEVNFTISIRKYL